MLLSLPVQVRSCLCSRRPRAAAAAASRRRSSCSARRWPRTRRARWPRQRRRRCWPSRCCRSPPAPAGRLLPARLLPIRWRRRGSSLRACKRSGNVRTLFASRRLACTAAASLLVCARPVSLRRVCAERACVRALTDAPAFTEQRELAQRLRAACTAALLAAASARAAVKAALAASPLAASLSASSGSGKQKQQPAGKGRHNKA